MTASVDYPERGNALRHSLAFASMSQRFWVTDERVEIDISGYRPDLPTAYYKYQNGRPTAASLKQSVDSRGHIVLEGWEEKPLSGVKSDQSILSQRNDPDSYPALSYLAEQYRSIKIYRNFNFDGPNSMRRAQQPDLPIDFLEEDGRNLSLVLNDLQHQGALDMIVEKLKAVYEDVESINVRVAGGTVQTFLRERGLSSSIPAARLSDGTLRYLCLLTILYHPSPPPLICLEEPEIGLHPDLISSLAEMLKEASQRTQIIVTTHSDLLVSKFSDQPEAVVVCERTPTGTTLKRLEAKALEGWLEEYSLGEVWLKGGIGGTRW
jgi:predicted ATPase